MSPPPPSLRLFFGCAVLALASLAAAVHAGPPVIPRARPAVEGNRAPHDLAFSPDGSHVYVTETGEGTVAVIDTGSFLVTQRIPTGGERPAGIAVSPDGVRLLVANTYSGSVVLLDVSDRRVVARVPVPGMPFGVAFSPDGKRGYATVSQLDEAAEIDLASGRVTRRAAVGRRPRALAITPDGQTLAVANLAGGSLSVVAASDFVEKARVGLKGINVRGVALTGSGEACLSVMPAFNRSATRDPREIWHNLLQTVTLAGATGSVGEDQWLDFARLPGQVETVGSPDPHGVAVDREGRFAWVAVAGRDMVTRVTLRDPRRNTIWPFSQIETLVGANPRGLALSPDGKQVWVANHLGNSVSVIDAAKCTLIRTIDLGPSGRVDPATAGRYLFHNAGLTLGHRFTCNSCHPDGGTDGLTWSFVHVNDGLARRNSRDLRAGVADTAPFRWTGHDPDLGRFIADEVTGLLYGPRPVPGQEAALALALRSMRLPPNPFRAPDGNLTPQAAVGKVLFDGKASCVTCHLGDKRGGTGIRAWVGTTPEGQKLDVPHLSGVYDGAPYLHDGRAETLEQVFTVPDDAGRHGSYHELSPPEQAALIRYLREL